MAFQWIRQQAGEQATHQGRQDSSVMDTHQPIRPGPGRLPRRGELGRHGLHTRGRGAARGCDAELGSGHGHAAVGTEPGRAWAGRRAHGWPPSCAAECAWGQTRLASQAPALSPGHSIRFPALQLENGCNPGDPSLPPSRGGRSGRRTRLPNRARPQVSGFRGIPASTEGGLTRSVTGGLSETHV